MIRVVLVDDHELVRSGFCMILSGQPDIEVVGEASNAEDGLRLVRAQKPDVALIDVHMPGMSGIEAARAIARRAALVFVTAYEQYAVRAFEQGALDYLVKPFDEARLADTVQRLKERLARPAAPPAALDGVLEQLARALGERGAARAYLQWIKASVGATLRLIPVEQVAFLRSDEKYTLVAWDGGEALIRTGIRELAEQLDPERFVQVHRSVIVNLHRVAQVVRGPNETAEVHLSGRPEVLPVSRSFLHVFRQM